MSAKKKSRFQITSVIQAQVAGNSITDDAESNDDLDESRAEDVSSDPVEVPRTGLSVCDRSSSEEDFDHTEEDHHGPVPVNGLLLALSTGGRNTPLVSGGSVPVVAASQPIVQTSTTQASSVSSGPPTSYSSRFRVIKLDHGTGEPFKRGRWACTEFYEKEFDSTRTMDSMKPTVTHDHNIERDSGIGVVCNSVATPRAFPAQSIEKIDNVSPKGQPVSFPSEPIQHLHGSFPPIGSVASAFQPTKYATAKAQQAHDKTPAISQNFIHHSLNGVHHGAMLQKSPAMPSAVQHQQLVYSNGVSPGQPEDHSQHFSASSQSFPTTSQPNVPQQPVSTIAGSEGKGLQVQSSEAPSLHPARVNAQAMSPVSQTIVKMGIRASSPITITSNSVQSVPATALTLSAASSRFSAAGDQMQDTRLKSDALPLPIADVVKPLITEGLSLSAPAVTLFGIPIPVDGDDDSASGASVVAIDNKIEQAMDLVKNHLMYAVREEVEVLKEQIKELYERNSVLERENAVLKSLANTEQLTKLSTQLKQTNSVALPQLQQQQSMSTNGSNAPGHYEVVKSSPHQPNITTA